MAGDLTVDVQPVTTPLETVGDMALGSLGETFNSMLVKAQSGLGGYNEVRETMRAALGDHSILADLDVKMKSIDNNCLVALGKGLEGLRNGDLTIDAQPVTTSIESANGSQIGSLGDDVQLDARQGPGRPRALQRDPRRAGDDDPADLDDVLVGQRRLPARRDDLRRDRQRDRRDRPRRRRRRLGRRAPGPDGRRRQALDRGDRDVGRRGAHRRRAGRRRGAGGDPGDRRRA